MTLNTQKWIIILICLCLVASSHFISNGCFISEHSVETACTDGRAVSEEMLLYPVDLSQCLPSPNVLEQDIKHLLDRSCWDCLPANISENPKWTHKFPAHTPSNHYLILPPYLMRCCPSVKSFSFVMQKVWFTQVSSQNLAFNLTMELNVWQRDSKAVQSYVSLRALHAAGCELGRAGAGNDSQQSVLMDTDVHSKCCSWGETIRTTSCKKLLKVVLHSDVLFLHMVVGAGPGVESPAQSVHPVVHLKCLFLSLTGSGCYSKCLKILQKWFLRRETSCWIIRSILWPRNTSLVQGD